MAATTADQDLLDTQHEEVCKHSGLKRPNAEGFTQPEKANHACHNLKEVWQGLG